jgi:hypothetical protein
MSQPSGYESYAFIADLYDYVIPYRDRPDVDFYVEAALQARGSSPGNWLRNGAGADSHRQSWR